MQWAPKLAGDINSNIIKTHLVLVLGQWGNCQWKITWYLFRRGELFGQGSRTIWLSALPCPAPHLCYNEYYILVHFQCFSCFPTTYNDEQVRNGFISRVAKLTLCYVFSYIKYIHTCNMCIDLRFEYDIFGWPLLRNDNTDFTFQAWY